MATRRNSVRRSAEVNGDASQLPSRRDSSQTQASFSTMSSKASPVDSNFPQEALAPRPPSYRRGQQGHERDFLEKRRRREDRAQQEADSLPPAPDVPRGAPPLSYKAPYSKSRKSNGQAHSRSYSAALPAKERDLVDSNPLYTTDRRPIDRPIDRERRHDRNTSEGDVPLSEKVTIHRGSSRRDRPTEYHTPRRDFAADKSPLQRLEVTLTKDEKRARAEEAEMFSRDRDSVHDSSDLHRNERAVAVEGPRRTRLEDPSAVDETREKGSRRLGRAYTIDRKPVATDYQPSRDDQPPEVIRRPENMQRGGNRQDQLIEPAVGAAAGVAAGVAAASVSRSNSNKLKKTPPGDPWYNTRMEAEVAGSQRTAAKERMELARNEDDYDSIDELEGRPLRRKSNKVEQLTGHKLGENRSITPQQQQLYADRLDRSEELGPGADERPANGHRHFHDIIHRDRDPYAPGDGMYLPEKRLSEWRKAGVAQLSGALLDLHSRQTEDEKNKAWWEGGGRGGRRASATRSGNWGPMDGEYDDTNGKVVSTFLLDDEDAPISLNRPSYDDARAGSVAHPRWSKDHDPVWPPARQYIGYQGSKEPTNVHRKNKSWLKNRVMPERAGSRGSKISSTVAELSPYSYDCVKVSEHNAMHPLHVCLSKNKQLTRSMRSIRIRSPAVATRFNPPLYLKCGPLLRYCGIRRENIPSRSRQEALQIREIWRGSVMIVTTDSQSLYTTVPTLRLFLQPLDVMSQPPEQVDGPLENLAPEHVDPIAGIPKISRDGSTRFVRPVEHLEEELDLSRDETDDGLFETHRSIFTAAQTMDGSADPEGSYAARYRRRERDGERLGKYQQVKGIRLHAEQGVTFWRFNIEVELRSHQQRIAYRINGGPPTGFWVPARGQGMNIMFHSCNGFSLSVNPDQFSGPDPMWRDVLNTHQSKPFHVMIGGGDQIYNDAIMKQTTVFQEWLSIRNPHEKHHAPFTPEMQQELETFYLERYSMWFSQGLFGLANSQIPMVNIFDDHDIIDGFGSYPHNFMDSPIFTGLGSIAFKYYMLFQHQSIIDEGEETEPSWVLGQAPGPYIKELSRSVFMSLGHDIAFLGLDCRTERTRDEIISPETYDRVLDRCEAEIIKGETKHLIVLLGVPVAYPRLVWLENMLVSPCLLFFVNYTYQLYVSDH
jgi:hypothetical protein